MSSTVVVFRPGPGVTDPMSLIPNWSHADYPPMGSPDDVRDVVNRYISEAGLPHAQVDEQSGVWLPRDVEALNFHVLAGQVRSLWVTRPTGPLLQLLCHHGESLGWRLFDVGSEQEYTSADFGPV